jgi:hypothetical protein
MWRQRPRSRSTRSPHPYPDRRGRALPGHHRHRDPARCRRAPARRLRDEGRGGPDRTRRPQTARSTPARRPAGRAARVGRVRRCRDRAGAGAERELVQRRGRQLAARVAGVRGRPVEYLDPVSGDVESVRAPIAPVPDRDARAPVPWSTGLPVAAFVAVFVGLADVLLSRAFAGAFGLWWLPANLLVCAGLTPSLWLLRTVPVLALAGPRHGPRGSPPPGWCCSPRSWADRPASALAADAQQHLVPGRHDRLALLRAPDRGLGGGRRGLRRGGGSLGGCGLGGVLDRRGGGDALLGRRPLGSGGLLAAASSAAPPPRQPPRRQPPPAAASSAAAFSAAAFSQQPPPRRPSRLAAFSAAALSAAARSAAASSARPPQQPPSPQPPSQQPPAPQPPARRRLLSSGPP